MGFWFQDIEKKLILLLQWIAVPLIDVLLLNLFIFAGRWIRFGAPTYGLEVWLVNVIYTLFYLSSTTYFGAYGSKRFSGRLSLYSALLLVPAKL